MKKIFAWLLLVTTTFQWVGGYLGIEIVESIEIKMQMSETEEALARQLKLKKGLDVEVSILDEDNFDFRSIGYSGFFAFSEELNNEKFYFTVGSQPSEIIDLEYFRLEDSIPQNDSLPLAGLKSLFSTFTFTPSHLTDKALIALENEVNFKVKNLIALFEPSISSPPPKLLS